MCAGRAERPTPGGIFGRTPSGMRWLTSGRMTAAPSTWPRSRSHAWCSPRAPGATSVPRPPANRPEIAERRWHRQHGRMGADRVIAGDARPARGQTVPHRTAELSNCRRAGSHPGRPRRRERPPLRAQSHPISSSPNPTLTLARGFAWLEPTQQVLPDGLRGGEVDALEGSPRSARRRTTAGPRRPERPGPPRAGRRTPRGPGPAAPPRRGALGRPRAHLRRTTAPDERCPCSPSTGSRARRRRRVAVPWPRGSGDAGALPPDRHGSRSHEPARRASPRTYAAWPACCRSSDTVLTRRTARVTGGFQVASTTSARSASVRSRT